MKATWLRATAKKKHQMKKARSEIFGVLTARRQRHRRGAGRVRTCVSTLVWDNQTLTTRCSAFLPGVEPGQRPSEGRASFREDRKMGLSAGIRTQISYVRSVVRRSAATERRSSTPGRARTRNQLA